jgi:hypothetical protein
MRFHASLHSRFLLLPESGGRTVQLSLREARACLLMGWVSSNTGRQPTDVGFVDNAIGKVKTFRIDVMEYMPP